MVNRVTLIGRVGKDIDLRYTQSGTAIASFSLATTEKVKETERTEWHNIVAWSRLAEIVAEYAGKGSLLYVEGRISYRTYDDKDGNKRYITEIVADTIRFISKNEQKGHKEAVSSANQYQDSGSCAKTVSVGDYDEIPF